MSQNAQEGGHWYTRDGKPMYEVPTAKGDRMRPTTVSDARKLDLVPSVTKVINQLAKPELERWRTNEVLDAVLAYGLPADVNEEAVNYWKASVLTASKEKMVTARDEGTKIHGIIERFIGDDAIEVDSIYHDRLLAVDSFMREYGVHIVEPEKSFACGLWGGYGGKIDAVCLGANVVIDFKTTDFQVVNGKTMKKGKKVALHRFDHALQLTAYGMGLSLSNPTLLNIFISTTTNDVVCHEWSSEDRIKALDIFENLTRMWWLFNK